MELSEIDVKILLYVKEHGSVSTKDIENAFPEIEAINLRLRDFYIKSESALLVLKRETVIDSTNNTVNSFSNLHITNLGLKTLQDYDYQQKSHIKELWLKNAWIPILVTLATNLLLGALKRLLPLIQELLSHVS